jgi:sugar phosphate isomerase/epimerase
LLVHNYFPPPPEPFVLNLASADAATRARSLELVLNALELTARLGAPFYSVHAGFITDPTGFGTTSFIFPMPESPREGQAAFQRFVASLHEALNHARRLGVRLLVENNVCSPELRGKLLLQTAAEYSELFQALPDEHLGILLDTGHLNVSAHTLGFDRMAFVEQVAPHVGALHLHDNDGTADTHQPITETSWVQDVLRHLADQHVPLIIEARFAEAASVRQHADWLRSIHT